MDRRRFLIQSGGVLGSLFVIGCGGNSGQNVQQPQSTGVAAQAAQGKTRVVYWSSWGGDNGKAMQKLVDDFNASQKEIFVENQFQGTYEETAQKLATALAARQVPEIASLSEVTWNRFYLNNSLAPLGDLLKTAGMDPTDYVESLINEGTKDGEIFWVPFARSTPLFYYNRDMFQKAGLPDRGPEKWDELVEWGEALKGKGGAKNVHAYTSAKNYNAWHFQGNVWQWDGRYSDENFDILIDEENAVEAGQWLRSFVHEKKMGYMAEDQSVDFGNGLAATTQQSTGSLGGIVETAKFEVGTAMLPEYEKFGCPTGGAGLGVLAAAPDERKQAAVEFIKFLGQPENVTFWSKTSGYMPVTNSARESEEMQSYFKENPNFQVAVEQLPKTQPQDTARTLIPNGDQTIGTGLERILVSNEDPATVFKGVAQQLESDAREVKDQVEEKSARVFIFG